MTRQVHTFTWRAIWAVMLFLGTLTHQPDPQTAFGDFAAYTRKTPTCGSIYPPPGSRSVHR